jgi:hypothetical protein
LAIDDFGSGYSTLGYLSELPFDEVKLDRKFIAPILSDARRRHRAGGGRSRPRAGRDDGGRGGRERRHGNTIA